MITGYQRDSQISESTNNFLRRVSQFCFPFHEKVVDSVPTTDDLPQGQALFYVSGATFRIYFNIQGSIKYLTLS